jgi:hypothetical protein
MIACRGVCVEDREVLVQQLLHVQAVDALLAISLYVAPAAATITTTARIVVVAVAQGVEEGVSGGAAAAGAVQHVSAVQHVLQDIAHIVFLLYGKVEIIQKIEI